MLDLNKVGIKIASLRKAMGYSQEKMAEILNISPQAISKWENGHTLPETSLLPVLSQIFGCTIDEIIMSAYVFNEKIEKEKSTVPEQQAEIIARHVVNKLDQNQKRKEYAGLSDDEIADAIVKIHHIKDFTIQRDKESRTDGRISTKTRISSPQKELNLIELIYHKRPDEFNAYAFLNGHINSLPQIYHVDHSKKLILVDDLSDDYIKGYDFRSDNENGIVIRDNLELYLSAAANWHAAFWENKEAFDKIGYLWHFEAYEHTLSWILDAMEKPFKKYRKNEQAGNIPKDGGICGKNDITNIQLDYFNDALQFLKTEYKNIVETRFQTGKNITVIHGDLHPGAALISKSSDRKVVFTGLQAVRQGLCTEDLAMFIALHIEPDKKIAQPLLDKYYKKLSDTVKDYPYEIFMNDYKLSIAENMFFTIRLINRGIFDFNMRDKAIKAYETFVLS